MDRRTFLTSSAALGVTASPSAASTIDPLVNMFARWARAKHRWYALAPEHDNLDAPEMLEAWAEKESMYDQMLTSQAKSLEGLRCQLVLLWEEDGPLFMAGSDGSETERKDPAFMLLAQILVGVESLTATPSWKNVNPKMLSPSQF
ncbi:MAG: hypothetical protein COB08_011105 [Rhodobacteraceae bacterium]|nr:hypothetical protein [Paracoccaceae bacterium]